MYINRSLCFIWWMLLIISCQNTEQGVSDVVSYNEDIALTWTLDSLDAQNGKSLISIEILNRGINILENNWTIYFNQIKTGVDQSSLPDKIKIERINGSYFKMYPSENFTSLKQGDSYKFQYILNGWIVRISDAIQGTYIVYDEQDPQLIEDVTISGVNDEVLKVLNPPTPQSRYREFEHVSLLDISAGNRLVPQPKSYLAEESNEMLELGSSIIVSIDNDADRAKTWISHLFDQFYTGKISFVQEDKDADIVVDLDNKMGRTDEYLLSIDEKVVIKSSGLSGILYAFSTLGQLVKPSYFSERKNELQLPKLTISDYSNFVYRGLHFDVSRNFHRKEVILKVLDLMAFYKLNKFHFHLTDDEGWRLEIPGLPELVDVGAQRGHTVDESDRLHPAYGSGPFTYQFHGSGFYNKSEFIEILKYANDRGIEIIPEIDFPGHARSAIIAMNARFDKLLAAGKQEEAEEYLLSDVNDQSKYHSAQGYNDNAICVCRESTYNFVEKVIDEIVKMYREADVELNTIHIGGDEVGYGAWQKSPLCASFLKSNSEAVSGFDALQSYFSKRLKSILDKHGLNTAGWEEIVLKNTSEGHNGKTLNPDFMGQNYKPYVWNAVWGWGREDMAYQLANAGYDIVMCNSAALYFDLAYNGDPLENGLNWSGMVDTKSPFALIPKDIFKNPIKRNNVGLTVPDSLYVNSVRLSNEGEKHFLGIQGHLWSETVNEESRVDYYYFPKVLGLAERAWNDSPEWSKIESKEDRIAAFEKDWNRFANALGQQQLPILDFIFGGVQYRIPLPGMRMDGNEVQINSKFPGLRIEYVRGKEKLMLDSSAKIEVGNTEDNVSARTVSTNGRYSRQSVIK